MTTRQHALIFPPA